MSRWTCFRSPCRSLITSITMEMLMPVIIQPMLVLFITFVIPENIPLITITMGIALVILIYLAKHDLRSHILYYWIVLSVTYTVIVFEFIVVPLCEIEALENFYLVLFSVTSTFFLYLTATANHKCTTNGFLEHSNGEVLLNGNGSSSICPACRIKMHPRNYHCHICQECILKYDHHCYWLNCCIGEVNLHYYMAGIFFGIFALTYGSLLTLTTICNPEFKFGILLPDDCTGLGDTIEMSTCLICGIYCLELAAILFFKVIYHSYLISRGLSSFEWREQYGRSLRNLSPYSHGFIKNWIQFFKKFKKVHL